MTPANPDGAGGAARTPGDPGAPDAAAIREALYENRSAPNGLARNARAEELVSLAEGTGETSLRLDSLFELMNAYLYSAERNKMFAPFARLLRMWDERPGDFDESDAHRLHWMFKWVAGGMLAHPEIPLASIEKWHAEMERRYRIAGYSVRPVHEDALWLAHQMGDVERADRALADWLAADRDQMSNCEACELNGKGDWYAGRGRDQDAVDAWEPVLDGRLRCGEEPHRVLAMSLLPLVRLGRTDEARAHHLRGYRLVRGDESLLGSVGHHMEFCALTGNEARGLEILAENAAHLRPRTGGRTRLSFLEGTAVLLRRLEELGHGARPAPAGAGTISELGARVGAEIGTITRRFDDRNGTSVVSDLARERCARQPLLAALPLGVKNAVVHTAPVRPVGTAPASGPTGAPGKGVAGQRGPDGEGGPDGPDGPDGLDALIAEGRRLHEAGHPGARAVWARVERAASGTGAELPPLVLAELAAERGFRLGLADAVEARAAFQDAADRYTELARPAESALSLSRAAMAAAAAGDAAWARARAGEARATVEELHARGAAGIRTLVTVRLSELRVRAILLGATPEDEFEPASALLDEQLTEMATSFERHEERELVLDRIADAERMRAASALSRDDLKEGEAALRRSVGLYVAGERPWNAVEPGHLLARVLLAQGDPEAARAAVEAALGHGAQWAEPEVCGELHRLLADIHLEHGRFEDAAGHALQAAHWFDTAGASAGPGAGARLLLGKAYEQSGRYGEAASVLESALPDLLAAADHDEHDEHESHDEVEAAVARQVLGRCLRRIGDYREAAEQFLLAADTAQHWEGQGAHALLASEAAASLESAGLPDQAEQAYRRAGGLWRELGDVVRLIRTLRARAWLAVRGDEDPSLARSLMAEADRELVDALAALETQEAGASGDDARELRFELAESRDQTARLLARLAQSAASEGDDTAEAALYEEALAFAVRASEGFAACGEPGFDDRIQAEILAAWIEADLSSATPARERVQAAAALCEAAGADEALARCRAALEGLGTPAEPD